MTDHRRIRELAVPPDHLDGEIAEAKPSGRSETYMREKRTQDLLIAIQDIHYLAMGLQEVMEKVEHIKTTVDAILTQTELNCDTLVGLLRRVGELENAE